MTFAMGMMEDAVKIVDDLRDKGIQLRIMGAIAFRLHCPERSDMYEKLDRPLTDIDFMGLGRDATRIMEYFESMRYKLAYGLVGERKIFARSDGIKVDVFLDKLSMCHSIDFEKRLSVDYPTVPLAELTLEKLQIVKITEKDIKDVCVLFSEHEIGKTDDDTINGAYIAKVLAKDWGFYYTTVTNLSKIQERSGQFGITDSEAATINVRIGNLREMIEKEPKSLGWKMRAVTGTKTKWYREVEDS
jgi:hypothetical protein